MRRFIVFLSIALVLAGIKMSADLTLLAEAYPEAEYVFFLGDGEVTVNIGEAEKTRKYLKGIRGEAVRIYGGEDTAEALIRYLNGAVIREENISGIRIIYGYTPKLGNKVTLSNDRINFQMAYSGGVITIGSPLIAGSY